MNVKESQDSNEGSGDTADFTTYRCSTFRAKDKHKVCSSGESPSSRGTDSISYESYYTETYSDTIVPNKSSEVDDMKRRLTDGILARNVTYKQYLTGFTKQNENGDSPDVSTEEVQVITEEVSLDGEIDSIEEKIISVNIHNVEVNKNDFVDTSGDVSGAIIGDDRNDADDEKVNSFDGDIDCKTYRRYSNRNSSDHKNVYETPKRQINPAVYIEDVDARSLGSNSVSSHYSTDHTTIVQSMRSSSTPFMIGKMGSPRHGSGSDTFRLSVTSHSTNTTANEQRKRDEERRRIAFEEWLLRKEQERKEQKRLEAAKNRPTPQTTPEQREESYRRWLQRKRLDAERQRLEESARRMRKEREHREAMRKEREKEERLEEWLKQKEEQMKEIKAKEEEKRAILAAEEEKRRIAGEKAFKDWLRTSRRKPLPVPLNQGELSMRGSISQMYVNPVEWQKI